MKISDIMYDISRHYINDRKSTLPVNLYNSISGAIRNRNLGYLAACATNSLHEVASSEAARTLFQVEAFFSKNAVFTDPVSARLTSLLNFEEGEALCAETNRRLDSFSSFPEDYPERIRKRLALMERWIDRVLGDHRDFLEKLPELIYVTSGATATRPRRRALPFLKVSKRLVCTPGAVPYIASLSEYFGYGCVGPRLISSNRIAFVPKSWKTDRTIACEAEGNIPLQLAFDSYAKSRLRRVGINLFDQTRNQELAKDGSIEDNLSTVDLSMASDTLAYNTVALLFNRDWFQYLRAIRSQYYTMYRDRREEYHKFSSMGNGATFPIETLVFAAACFSVGARTFSVYGDDIVIDRNVTEPLMELLAFLGFVPNTDKTYSQGPFRESCGKFWYKGVDITPKYIRGLDSRKASWCHLVNNLVTICTPMGQLMDYALHLCEEQRLPFVPYNESSISGVWITPSAAYDRKLIRISKRGLWAWQPRIKAYQPQVRCLQDWSSRSLFLWHLMVHGKKRRDAYQSSRYYLPSHKYVRKWVHWKPVAGGPDHLNWWSDLALTTVYRSQK